MFFICEMLGFTLITVQLSSAIQSEGGVISYLHFHAITCVSLWATFWLKLPLIVTVCPSENKRASCRAAGLLVGVLLNCEAFHRLSAVSWVLTVVGRCGLPRLTSCLGYAYKWRNLCTVAHGVVTGSSVRDTCPR